MKKQELYRLSPDYHTAIIEGRHARHLWYALRDWRGQEPEVYFGKLGTWAEERLKELALK